MSPLTKGEGFLKHILLSGLIAACSFSLCFGEFFARKPAIASTACPVLEHCICSVSTEGANTFCENMHTLSDLNGDMARLAGVIHRKLSLARIPVTELPVTWFSNHTVIMLSIRQCPLSDIGEASIANIKRLSHIRLDYNELAYVPGGLAAAKRLRWLQIRRNRIKSLQGVLSLHELVELDLSYNEIEAVDENYLSNLPKLVFLNLSHNKMQYLSPNIFKKTRELKSIILHGNSIATINDVFQGLHCMENLDLRRNMIGDIDALLTSIMPNLKTAYFDYNKISSIPDFSTSKSMIKELVFRNNRIVQIAPTAFKSFKEMSRLDLSNNNIRHLNETAFSANSRLESLILNWNRLTTVTGVFNRTPQIRHLRLSFNQIRNITAAFNGLTKLRSLSIRNNLLTCIPDDTFRDNRGLQKVTLNENDIQWIGRDAFQGLDKLKIITLRNNRLLTLNNSMRNLPKLQYIDASFNAIQGLETGEFARNINLAAVLLAGNNISSVKGAFVAATYLRMLKIDGNRLLLISRGDFAPKMRSKPSLIINNNPLMCDCRLAWLVHNNSQVRLKEQFTCMGPRWLQGKSMLSLTEDDLVGWEDDCESGCHCRCKEDPSGVRVMTVDCSKAKLGHFPKRLPGNTTALYLQDNGLVLLDDRLKRKAPRLQLLSLRNNRLTDFNVSAVPTTVTSLDLRGNRLKQLPYSLVTEHTFTFLWLSDNPFRCDCADYNFSQWIQAHGEVAAFNSTQA